MKIWLLAILYQTIIFSFCLNDFWHFAILIIPIEFIGSLPGLFLFGVFLKHLHKSDYSIDVKWFLITFGVSLIALLSAFFTGLSITSLSSIMMQSRDFLLPAPSAGLLALFTLPVAIHKVLRESLFKNISSTNDIS